MTIGRTLAAALFTFGICDAQVSFRYDLVHAGRTEAELSIVSSVRRLDSLRWDNLSGGERVVTDELGRPSIVRRIGLILPTEKVSMSADRVLTETGTVVDIGPEQGDSTRDSFSGVARLVAPAPVRNGHAVTLEVIIASLEKDSRTVKIYSSIRVRLQHDAWQGGGPWSVLIRPWSDALDPGFEAAGSARKASRFAAGNWYRFDVSQTGMYKLTAPWFRRAGVQTTELEQISRLRLFGNGGRPLPEDISIPRPVGLVELPRLILDNNGNGTLDDDDAVIMFCSSVRGWTYQPATRQFSHTMNPYAEKNAYFFTFDPDSAGRSMDSLASLPSAPVTATGIVGRIVVEEEKVNFVRSGRLWVGSHFGYDSPSTTFINALPGYENSDAVRYRAFFYSRSSTVDTFRVLEHDEQVGSPVIMGIADVFSPDQTEDYAYESGIRSFQRSAPLPEPRSVLKVMFGTRNQASDAWVDWIEIFYRRKLEAEQDRFDFPTIDTTAVIAYTIRNLSSREVVAFDVTDHANVRRITGLEFDPVDATVCTFRLSHTSGSVSEIAVAGASGYLSPDEARTVPASNLRGFAGAATFIIISPPEFLEEANRLKQHRESFDGLPTMVADLSAVFDEFGGGLPDPFAIRDFLAYARSNYSGNPHYVLMFGNGHFDYRNISTSVRNWVIPYESDESNWQINTYTSDDYFVRLDPGNPRPSLAIGRLPARSVEEMKILVDKIIRYETASPFDPWRNRVTFVSDDGQTSGNPNERDLHNKQSEDLAQSYTPNSMEKRKIYSVEYPVVLTGAGRRKPDANTAIVSAFNNGTLILNFTGHGNPELWTHEWIFTRDGDIPKLRNADRLTFLVAATCNYAQWDDPGEQSSGEVLMVKEDGGAAAVVTSTRSVWSGENSEFNKQLYNWLFTTDSLGLAPRLGEVLRLTKQIRFGVNDQKYHLLGDPTLRLLRPRTGITIDSVNNTSTSNVSEIPTLGVTRVNGILRALDGSTETSFSGRGIIELFDSRRTYTVPEWGNFQYEKTGSVLYRGEISVVNGSFAAQIPVPKDVTYGGRARVSLYAFGDGTDAVGTTDQVLISGTDSTAETDTTGPSISIYLETEAFRPGDVVSSSPSLIVDLSDASGINTSSVGIGHRLEALVQPSSRVVDLSEAYRSDLDTYQSGRSVAALSGLEEGKHIVRVRAWDIFNNSSTAEASFEVREGGTADVYQVMNFPNPFSGSTRFTMQRPTDELVDITIKVYTVSGRLIQELRQWSVAERFVAIPWNGKDKDDNDVANGVYLYKVFVRSTDGSSSSETIGKFARVR